MIQYPRIHDGCWSESESGYVDGSHTRHARRRIGGRCFWGLRGGTEGNGSGHESSHGANEVNTTDVEGISCLKRSTRHDNLHPASAEQIETLQIISPQEIKPPIEADAECSICKDLILTEDKEKKVAKLPRCGK